MIKVLLGLAELREGAKSTSLCVLPWHYPRRLIKHPFELEKLEEDGGGLEGEREPSTLLEQAPCLPAQQLSIAAESL